jgi:RNA polymerase sigma-70 factor, ECF subfamily
MHSGHRSVEAILALAGNPDRVLIAMTSTTDPDVVLMLRVQQGDMSAFEVLVEKYKQPVMNLIYRSLPDAAEAEDLAQNVFVQVFKSAHRYRDTARFSTWLFTIARNLCLNEIRRRSRHPAESLDLEHPENEDQPFRQFEDLRAFSPPDALLQGELERKIEEILAQLPENQRIALLLCRQEDVSYEEIAAVLECSLSATKSLIHRARETLKQRLKPYLRTGVWKETPKERNFPSPPVLEREDNNERG